MDRLPINFLDLFFQPRPEPLPRLVVEDNGVWVAVPRPWDEVLFIRIRK